MESQACLKGRIVSACTASAGPAQGGSSGLKVHFEAGPSISLHGIGLQLLQAIREGSHRERQNKKILHGKGLEGRRPNPDLLVPDASRQQAEANLRARPACARTRSRAHALAHTRTRTRMRLRAPALAHSHARTRTRAHTHSH